MLIFLFQIQRDDVSYVSRQFCFLYFKIVKDLRKQRAQCIQTEVQYLYFGRVLVEYAVSQNLLKDDAKSAADNFLKEYDSQRKEQMILC